MTQFPQHKKREGKCLSPKMVPLREEFISLTNDPLIAIVLNQLLYWSQRVKDFDLHLQEEQFINPDCNVAPRHGWIYKTANDLIEETMICVDRTTMRRYLKFLMDQGWLEERSHPKNKWDKTSQYRLNLRKLQEDLYPLGFELPGIELFLQKEFIHRNDGEGLISDPSEMAEISNGDFTPSREDFAPSKEHHSNGQFAPSTISDVSNSPSNGYLSLSKEQNAPSSVTNSPLYIQRIQTENINKDQQQRPLGCENFSDFENSKNSASKNSIAENHHLANSVSDKSVAEEMASLWEWHVVQNLPPILTETGNKKFHLTEERKGQLESLFAFHFQNDMRLWERFCLRIKASSFLMGGGENGWHVRLDWILRGGNVSKVLEGNYDDSKRCGQQESSEGKLEKIQVSPAITAEKAAILATIKDPIWREWCSRLAEGVRYNEFKMVHEPLSVRQLQQIANAAFLECEDGQLVWVGSFDQRVLNKIDDLRLKINWVFAKEYPKARTFRTRLESSNPTHQPPITGEHHHE